jgi:hypothetical protein
MVTCAIPTRPVSSSAFQQHLIGFVSVIVGKSEIRGAQIDGVGLLLLNKRKNLLGLSGFRSNSVLVFVVDQHVVSLFVFVAFDYFIAVHDPVASGQNSGCFKRV